MPRFSRTTAAGLLGLVLMAPLGLAACVVVESPGYRAHHYHRPYYGPAYAAPVILVPAPRGYDRHDHARYDRRRHHR